MKSLVALASCLLVLPFAAFAIEIPVSYSADFKQFKQNVAAGDSISFELHIDAGCSGAVHVESLTAGTDSVRAEKVLVQKVKGQSPRPAKVMRLSAVLSAPNMEPQFFVRAVGTGIAGAPSDCQALRPSLLVAGCPPNMVPVIDICVDKYEASVWSTPAVGGIQYGATITDDYPCSDDGQDCEGLMFARSLPGVTPSRNLTWFQAQQACNNAGKRLLTNAEWQRAVAGTPDGSPCEVNDPTGPGPTGSPGCESRWGTMDMVGGVHEWTSDWMPFSEASPGWGSFSDDIMSLSGASTTAMAPAAPYRGGNSNNGTDAGPFFVVPGRITISSSDYGVRCAR